MSEYSLYPKPLRLSLIIINHRGKMEMKGKEIRHGKSKKKNIKLQKLPQKVSPRYILIATVP